jgi:NTE family protein
MKFKTLTASLLLSLTLSACAGSSGALTEGEGETEYQGTAINDGGVESEAVTEQYGPAVPTPEEDAAAAANAAATPAAPPVTPAPPAPAPEAPKLCLVLGPGMAKALAEAAVLEAIQKAKIPVHCVVGTEMGALVGALFSQANGNANALQWQLFKLNNENYFNFPMLSLREPKASGRRLHEFLRDLFRQQRIENLPLRFATAAADLDRDAIVTFDKGDVADALSATLAMPGIFEPWRVGQESLYSGAVSAPAPFELARKLGGNFFVLIDVVEDNSNPGVSGARFQKAFSPVRNLIRLQKKEASFAIQIPAGHLAFDDFSRQGEILATGTRAAAGAVPELKAAWEKWVASH